MVHTTNAPMFVALPFTTVWSRISTLLAQQALFLSELCSLVSLSRRVIAPVGSIESVDTSDIVRLWPPRGPNAAIVGAFQYGGELMEAGEAMVSSVSA